MMLRLRALVRLFFRFIGQCLSSGTSTARVILQWRKPGRKVQGIVRLRFAPMSEAGAALLGAMVSLTPGNSAIDIDLERREMLLHMLDIEAAEANLASIRHDFERDIAILFPPRALR